MELYIHSPHTSQDSGVQLGNNNYKPDIDENTSAFSCILFNVCFLHYHIYSSIYFPELLLSYGDLCYV